MPASTGGHARLVKKLALLGAYVHAQEVNGCNAVFFMEASCASASFQSSHLTGAAIWRDSAAIWRNRVLKRRHMLESCANVSLFCSELGRARVLYLLMAKALRRLCSTENHPAIVALLEARLAELAAAAA